MTPEQALAFALFAFVAAVTPGPSNVLLTATGANVGIRRGLPCFFGVCAGMGVMMFIVAFGLGALVLDNPTVLEALKWCGAAFLLWLAWKVATAGRPTGTSQGDAVGFLGAAAFQWVNPKSWLATTSAAGAYLQADAGSAFVQSAGFCTIFLLVSLPSCFIWLAFGAGVQRFLSTDRAARSFNIAMGLLLAASVYLIVR